MISQATQSKAFEISTVFHDKGMTMFIEFVAVFGLFVVFRIIVLTTSKSRAGIVKNPPPEPPSIPLLGHLNVFMGDGPLYKTFAEYSRTYGPVIQFRLATSKILILNDEKSVTEAFLQRSEDFAGRPKIFSVSLLSRNDSGIVFSDYSSSWKLHKRLTGIALQRYVKPSIDVGYNGSCKTESRKISVCERTVCEEIDNLVEVWKNEAGSSQEMDISSVLQITLMNTVCNLTFSRHYQPDHPELRAFFVANQNLKKIFKPGHPLDVFPILRIFPWQRLRTIEELTSTRDAILQREYEYHLGTFEPNRIRNITDALLAIRKDVNQNDCSNSINNDGVEEGPSNYGQSDLTEDHVIMSMWEVFAGGFESTFQILRWAIAFIVTNPHVQTRIRQEIKTNIERGQKINWEDRLRLPYLMASILETMRKASFSSLNAPHRTTRDTQVGGYNIDANTTVFTNLWWIHNNPEKWENPHLFYPEHFLDDNGKVATPKCFFPFSAGARVCLGEKMAKMQLFLFLGRILHSFHLEPALDGDPPNTEPESNDPVRIIGPYRITVIGDELMTSA